MHGLHQDGRLEAPATRRNRDPILDILRRVFPHEGLVVEVASGTGQHAVHFAAHLTGLRWQPTEPDAASRRSVAAWAAHEGLGNVLPPLDMDVTQLPWPVPSADAVFNANMIHISPWACCEGLFAGAAALLASGAPLVVYGPFRIDGRHTAPSNEAFDRMLRSRDPTWGVRDLEAVMALADEAGFQLEERVTMPANNQTLVFRRARPSPRA